jgi:HK97 gp10 family phage protein
MAAELTGVKELANRLTMIRDIVRQQGTRDAVYAGGAVIRKSMREKTPVLAEKMAGSNSLNPGDIKRGIRIRMKVEDDEAVALIGPTRNVGKIAHLVEYGHRMVTGGKSKMNMAGIFVGGGKVHAEDVPPYPFLRPAFETSAASAMQAIVATLKKELDEAAQ